MVRTSMFDSGDNKNYQAQGNVIALGRIHGTDTNDHGDFNGIEKALTVNPNSELIFEFNTMTTKNGQGATNVIIKMLILMIRLLKRLLKAVQLCVYLKYLIM